MPTCPICNERPMMQGNGTPDCCTECRPPEVGEFIEVPAWQTFGQVVAAEPASMGSDYATEVTLQEHPEQPARKWPKFRLEPGEYNFV